MAIGWLTALKVIPWGDVLEAAPHIVKGAKRLFAKTKDDASDSPLMSRTVTSSSDGEPANLEIRIRQVQAAVEDLDAEQKSSAELIKSLAEQNARVVEVIELFRIRTKILMIACVLLSIGLVTLAFLVVTK